MDFTQYIGITGALTYLLSYILLQIGRIDGNGNFYAFLNMVAAGFVMISLTTKFNIGSAIIQVSFISLSLYAILRSFLNRRAVKLAPMEDRLSALLFPDLPPRRALALMRQGSWHNASDTQLAFQDQPLENLSVLMTGQAVVRKAGTPVAMINPGQVVGEVSWWQNSPASADVVLQGSAYYFTISIKTLRAFLSKNTDVATSFEAGLRNQLLHKLT